MAVRSKVPIGLTSIIGWAVALAGLLPIGAKVLEEGRGITVGGPERWLAIAGLVCGGLTQMGRFLQAAVGVSVTVKAHITTWLGYLAGLAGLLPVLIASYSEGSQALHSPEKYAAIAGIVFLAVNKIGRYLQTLPIFAARVGVADGRG